MFNFKLISKRSRIIKIKILETKNGIGRLEQPLKINKVNIWIIN